MFLFQNDCFDSDDEDRFNQLIDCSPLVPTYLLPQSPALLFHVCLAEPYVWNTEAKNGELNSSGLASFVSTVFSFQNSNDHRSHATTIRSEQEASVSYYPFHPDHVRFIFSSQSKCKHRFKSRRPIRYAFSSQVPTDSMLHPLCFHHTFLSTDRFFRLSSSLSWLDGLQVCSFSIGIGTRDSDGSETCSVEMLELVLWIAIIWTVRSHSDPLHWSDCGDWWTLWRT